MAALTDDEEELSLPQLASAKTVARPSAARGPEQRLIGPIEQKARVGLTPPRWLGGPPRAQNSTFRGMGSRRGGYGTGRGHAGDGLARPVRAVGETVAVVRAFARERFAEVSHASLEDLVLVVSELATNVVGHAHTRFWVGFGLSPGLARIEVADQAPWTPSQGFPTLDLRGRGLLVVRALCEDWGVEFLDGSKKVWAEVAVSMPLVAALRWN